MAQIRAFSKLARPLHSYRQSAQTQAERHEGQGSGSYIMEKNNNSIREIGQLMSVAVAALLAGSTLILSAVGPARASEAPTSASQAAPMALCYLA
ncbi:MAG: hypothetical protein CMN64_18010 [Sphingobium sp.]|jgi:hypothetical protein|nr:hypothetical protein [Sphingobium sp.]